MTKEQILNLFKKIVGHDPGKEEMITIEDLSHLTHVDEKQISDIFAEMKKSEEYLKSLKDAPKPAVVPPKPVIVPQKPAVVPPKPAPVPPKPAIVPPKPAPVPVQKPVIKQAPASAPLPPKPAPTPAPAPKHVEPPKTKKSKKSYRK